MEPVNVPPQRVYIQGPPVIVDAPPVNIAPAQIYLEAPNVRVRPSEVTVAPPEVHFVEPDPNRPRYILTEPWIGYRFNPQGE